MNKTVAKGSIRDVIQGTPCILPTGCLHADIQTEAWGTRTSCANCHTGSTESTNKDNVHVVLWKRRCGLVRQCV